MVLKRQGDGREIPDEVVYEADRPEVFQIAPQAKRRGRLTLPMAIILLLALVASGGNIYQYRLCSAKDTSISELKEVNAKQLEQMKAAGLVVAPTPPPPPADPALQGTAADLLKVAQAITQAANPATKDLREAVRMLTRALELEPGNDLLWHERGKAKQFLKDSSARKDYDEATRLILQRVRAKQPEPAAQP